MPAFSPWSRLYFSKTGIFHIHVFILPHRFFLQCQWYSFHKEVESILLLSISDLCECLCLLTVLPTESTMWLPRLDYKRIYPPTSSVSLGIFAFGTQSHVENPRPPEEAMHVWCSGQRLSQSPQPLANINNRHINAWAHRRVQVFPYSDQYKPWHNYYHFKSWSFRVFVRWK